MTATATQDLAALALIRGEVERSLSEVEATLAGAGGTEIDSQALRTARRLLAGVPHALELAGAQGLANVLHAIDGVLADVQAGDGAAAKDAVSLCRRACAAVRTMLGDAQAIANPLSLAPIYGQLLRTRGDERLPEIDLFFPDTDRVLEDAIEADGTRAEDAAATFGGLRARFEEALLRWLRGDGQALQAMHAALNGAAEVAPDAQWRTFWYVAATVIDLLAAGALEMRGPLMRLGSTLDQDLRRCSSGGDPAPESLRTLLYFVWSAPDRANSQRVAEIRRTFALDQIRRDTDDDAHNRTNALARLKSGLEPLKVWWERACESEPGTRKEFQWQLAALRAACAPTSALSELLDVVALAAKRDPAESADAGTEVATLLLLLEHLCAGRSEPQAVFQQLRKLMIQLGTPPLVRNFAPGADTAFLEGFFREPLANELIAVLTRAQDDLSAFFEQPSRRKELDRAVEALSEVRGVLTALGEAEAVAAVTLAIDIVAQIAAGNGSAGDAQVQRVAAVISALLQYIEQTRYGGADEQGLSALARLTAAPLEVQTDGSEAQHSAAATPDAATGVDALQVAAAAESPRDDAQRFDAEPAVPRDAAVSSGAIDVAAPPSESDALASNVDLDFLAAGALRPTEEAPRFDSAAAPPSAQVQDVDGQLQLFALAAPLIEIRALAASADAQRAELGALLPRADIPQPAIEASSPGEQGEVQLLPETHAAQLELDLLPPEADGSHLKSDAPALSADVPQSEIDLSPAALGAEANRDQAAAAPSEANAPASEPIATAPEHPVDRASDQDMLPVFLEESKQVLAAIEAAMARMRAQSGAVDALTVVGRGMHTLTGSGRIVGLTHLAEVAWTVEQALNRVLERKWPVTQELTRFIECAHGRLSTWVDHLARHGAAIVDGDEVLNWARAVSNAELVPAPLELIDPETSDPDRAVQIGTVRLSPTLYNIYLAEAQQRLEGMHTCFAALGAQDAIAAVSESFVRHAHTLAGISGTTGFLPIHRLGEQLELVLRQLYRVPQRISPAERDLIERTLGALSDMVGCVRRGTQPEPAVQLVDALSELQRRLAADETQASLSTQAPAQEQVPLLPAHFEPALPAAHSEPELPTSSPEPSPLAARPEPELPAALAEPALPAAPWEAAVSNAWPEPELPPARTEPDESVDLIEPDQSADRASTLAELVPLDERLLMPLEDAPDAQLLPTFLQEAAELLPQIGHWLRQWRIKRDSSEIAAALQRLLHTLKGSARMAGAMAIGELTHNMESRVQVAARTPIIPDALLDSLEASLDRLGLMVDRLQRPEQQRSRVEGSKLATPSSQQQAMLRVRAALVDHLVNEASELAVTRVRAMNEVKGLRHSLTDLTDSIIRLRAQVREIEIQAELQIQSRVAVARAGAESAFDPLEFDRYTRLQELTRFIAESVNDLATVQHGMLERLDACSAGLTAQAQITRVLQDELRGMQLTPVAALTERLYRVARLTARETGKPTRFDIVGGQVALDRAIVERMAGPLEHLLRNAIVHGIEDAQVRRAAGKPETGQVTLEARQEGNEVLLMMSDDGAGLNLDGIRRKAIELGMIAQNQTLSQAQVVDLIFNAGVSTAPEVTQLAGRGVGLDAVRNEVGAAGGRIEVKFEPGRGSSFLIHVPVTLSVLHALVVRSAERSYALPAQMVDQVRSVRPQDMEVAYEAGFVAFKGQHYPLHHLQHLLGNLDYAPLRQRFNALVLLHSGTDYLALHVDAFAANQEIVVKPIGEQVARVTGITGAAMLGTGQAVLILNPVLLVHRRAARAATPAWRKAEAQPLRSLRPVVMVVDDSITVRKITSRLLAREGYEVVQARDGVEAIELLNELRPDVVLTDIEMPRMDGLDLLRQLRADARLSSIPVIVISSRTADKHRELVRELGADLFLGKPYDDEELLGHIAHFVGARADERAQQEQRG